MSVGEFPSSFIYFISWCWVELPRELHKEQEKKEAGTGFFPLNVSFWARWHIDPSAFKPGPSQTHPCPARLRRQPCGFHGNPRALFSATAAVSEQIFRQRLRCAFSLCPTLISVLSLKKRTNPTSFVLVLVHLWIYYEMFPADPLAQKHYL